MKTTTLLSLTLFMFATNALPADSGNISMFPMAQPSSAAPERSGSGASQANTLRSSDRARIAKFVNANLLPHWTKVPIYSVVESGGASVGGGKSEFLVLLDISGRGYSNILIICSRGTAGNVQSQVIDGWKMGNLKGMVQDLNGDGTDELIIPEEIGPGGVWVPLMDMPSWPAVYRIENGKYVEASRDFPNYYDTEVLPQLDESISDMGQKASEDSAYMGASARSLAEKDKILRVLGRNPAAGLQQAYR